jgi:hypothetical protein
VATAYIDTSPLVAVEFNEPGGVGISRRLNTFDRVVSSNLLEAEMRSAFAREGMEFNPSVISSLQWVNPTGPLSQELTKALAVGYLRGAELCHVATTLYAFPEQVGETTFLTLDRRQQAVAAALGFQD